MMAMKIVDHGMEVDFGGLNGLVVEEEERRRLAVAVRARFSSA